MKPPPDNSWLEHDSIRKDWPDEFPSEPRRLVALDHSGNEVATFTRQADGSWACGPMTTPTIVSFRLDDGSVIPAFFNH